MMVKIMSNSKRIKEKVHFYVSILAGAVQTSTATVGLYSTKKSHSFITSCLSILLLLLQ